MTDTSIAPAALSTTAQRRALRTLIARGKGYPEVEAIRLRLNEEFCTHRLTADEAAAYIKEFNIAVNANVRRRFAPASAPEPVAEAAPVVQTNRFGAYCERCGRWVQAETGVRTRGPKADGSEGWIVSHAEACVIEFSFPEGGYALDLDGEVKFYLCKDAAVVAQGGPNTYPVSIETAHKVVNDISVDPQAAAERYGRELGVCGCCGRDLTNATSRARGIGPVCAQKRGWM